VTRPRSQAAVPRGGREVELSLVVVSGDPAAVSRRLARLRAVGPYDLRPRGSDRIVDRYFDTVAGTMRKRGFALRLRTVGGATTIGLKGRRRRASTRTEDRLEHERPFSPEAAAELGKRAGLRPNVLGSGDGRGDPDAQLEVLLGVRLVQRRETKRLLRDVLDGREKSGPVLAELALDRVRFELGSGEVQHYEVELEAKRTGRGTEAARAVATELALRYSDELAHWPYGKLPTGKAIEKLVGEGRLEGLRHDGTLEPRAYDQIRRYLQRSATRF
jgi:hypothetical protein